jgi:hypothetical protein
MGAPSGNIIIAAATRGMSKLDDTELLGTVLGKHGGDRRSKEFKDQGCNTTLKRGTAAHWLARLARPARSAPMPPRHPAR